MRATLIIHCPVAFGNRGFAEMAVWRVPDPVPPTMPDLKYRMGFQPKLDVAQ